MRRLPVIASLSALLVCLAVGAAEPQSPVRRTPAEAEFIAAIDLAPAGALSVAVVPSVKLAADDLAECLARVGGDASAVPLRPLDLLRGQLGIGNGMDESGALVFWSEMRDGAPVMAALVPVTDPKALTESSLQKVDGQEGAFTHPRLGTVHLREVGRRLLVSPSRELVQQYAPRPGLSVRLKERLGERGWSVLVSGDVAAWAGPEAMRAMRSRAEAEARARGGRVPPADEGAATTPPSPGAVAERQVPPSDVSGVPSADVLQRADLDGNGTIDSGDQSVLLMEMGNRGPNAADLNGDGVVDETDLDLMKACMGQPVPAKAVPKASPAPAQPQTPAPAAPAAVAAASEDAVVDGVVSVDLDPLGISVRSYAVLDGGTAMGRAARGGPRGAAPRLDRLPRGAFVLAAAADMRGLGGGDAFLDLLAVVPGAPALPAWVRENRDLLSGAQVAVYPSKLGVAGGLLNEAMVWLQTSDAAKARQLMRDWMQGFAGVEGATERKVSWEAGKTLKDGQTADAYAVTEAPAPADAKGADGARPRSRRNFDPMQRLVRSFIFGPRGPNGFAKDFPDGLLMTFSQRPDVLQRATRAAGGAETLQGSEVIESLRGWLTPDPDVVGYVGVGSMLSVARQLASSFPGASLELPDAPPDLEPIAFSLEVQDGRVETATMVPAGVVGVMRELYEMRQAPPEDDEGADEAPAPRAPARRSPRTPDPAP